MPGYDETDYQILKQIAEGGIEYTHLYGYQPAGRPGLAEEKIDGRTLKRFERLGLIEYRLTDQGQRVLGQIGAYWEIRQQGGTPEAAVRAMRGQSDRNRRDGTKAALAEEEPDLPPAPKRAIIDKADLAKVIARNLGPEGQPQRFLEWANRETTSMADVIRWATERDIREAQAEFNELAPEIKAV